MPANPAWYTLRLTVGGASGESPRRLDALFAEAIRRQPDYVQTWQAREKFLEPMWGGSTADVVALADLGRRTVSAAEGRGMMVETLAIGLLCNCTGLLADPGIDWKAVRASMDDVLERYPDDVNTQRFLYIACLRSDKPLAQHLMEAARQPASPTLLGANARLYAMCHSWAQGKLPAFLIRDPATGLMREIR